MADEIPGEVNVPVEEAADYVHYEPGKVTITLTTREIGNAPIKPKLIFSSYAEQLSSEITLHMHNGTLDTGFYTNFRLNQGETKEIDSLGFILYGDDNTIEINGVCKVSIEFRVGRL